MLIDRFLPAYDVVERHRTTVHAPIELVWATVRSADLARSPTIRLLLLIRGMRRRPFTFQALAGDGFRIIGEDPPREIVIGIVGRPWLPKADVRSVDDFEGFDEPGLVKIAWNFRLSEVGEGTRLETETRIRGTDATATRRFKRYWFVVGRFSGLIRLRALALVKREAERAAT